MYYKEMYQVCDWLTDEVIAEFWTEDARDDWMDENCDWYSDGIYMKDSGQKVYRQKG